MTTENASAKLLMLNKPKGYVVTRSDVYTLCPAGPTALTVGQLDLDSKGLLLFTRNDKLADRITQPGSCLKTYEVWVRGLVTQAHIKQALKGVENSGELLKVFQVEIKGGAGHKTKLEVVLDEGKNRHIRRLFGSLKDMARNARRFWSWGGGGGGGGETNSVSAGWNLDVESGKWRFLNQDEELLLS